MFTKRRAKPGAKKIGCLGIVGLLFLCSLPAVFTQERSSTAPTTLVATQPNAPTEQPTALAAAPLVSQLVELPTATPMMEPTPSPTPAPLVLPTNTPIPPLAGATVNAGANLRAGPGVDYPVMNTAAAGAAITLVGRNPAGDWYQIADGLWIATSLVDNAPLDLTVVAAPAPPPVIVAAPAQPAAEAPATGNSNPDAFVCNGGCAQPPPGSTCVIKGNVNSNNERIYHMPGGRHYTRTDIKPEEGDRWFCTTSEAEAAGFRASEN